MNNREKEILQVVMVVHQAVIIGKGVIEKVLTHLYLMVTLDMEVGRTENGLGPQDFLRRKRIIMGLKIGPRW